MAEVAEREQQQARDDEGAEQHATNGAGKGTALRTAAAVAAAGAAAIATRKVLAKRTSGSNGGQQDRSGSGGSARQAGSMLKSAAEGSWDAARDALVPIAEDMAGVAGKYLAQKGPDVVVDQIVPRFISSFNEAREQGK